MREDGRVSFDDGVSCWGELVLEKSVDLMHQAGCVGFKLANPTAML